MKVVLDRVSKAYGSRTLLNQLGWEIGSGRKIALVGPNGTGKSTLLGIISGRVEPDSGRVIRGQGRIALMEQEYSGGSHTTLFEACRDAFRELLAEGERLAEMEARFPSLTAGKQLEYAARRERFIEQGGYDWERRIWNVLQGLGFSEQDGERPLNQFSGGQRRRAMLARTLLEEPGLLILDEPTNHLDLESVDWLAGYLAERTEALLFVSHDRWFLDQVAEEIVELEHGLLEHFPGNFQDYRRERTARRQRQHKAYQQQQAEIERTEDFIRRNIAGQKTRQAQSRRRMLERIERLEPPPRDAGFELVIKKARREGRCVVEADSVTHGYGDRVVLQDISFTAWRGEKIGLLGRNGSGKSTLLRLIVGEELPQQGRLRLAENVVLGYFPQEGGALDEELTVLDQVWKDVPGASEQELRSLLGAFLFSGEEVQKPVHLLSGGEKSRLQLTRLLLARPNLLVLDEPTNHLDLPARLMLESALAGFDGTAIIVSHDRSFLDEVVTCIYHINNMGLTRYAGNVSDNSGKLLPAENRTKTEKREQAVRKNPASRTASESERIRQAGRGANKYLIGRIEEQIEILEQEIRSCEAEMVSEQAVRDGRVFAEIKQRHDQAQAELEERYREWEEACS